MSLRRRAPPANEVSEPVTFGESVFAAIWVVVFIVARHFLMPWLDSIHLYAIYGLDAVYVLFSLFFFAEGRFKLHFPMNAWNLAWIGAMILLGTATYQSALFMGIKIPFDLTDAITLGLLLIVAPILEELLFRQALWYSIDTASARSTNMRRWCPLVATSVLFSLAHFEAYFAVPPEFQIFVLYQTAYTLAIAVFFGRAYEQTQSVGYTMALHFGFNFGFFLGSVI